MKPSVTVIAWHNDSVASDQEMAFEVRRVPSSAMEDVVRALTGVRGFINVEAYGPYTNKAGDIDFDIVVGFDEHNFDYSIEEVEVNKCGSIDDEMCEHRRSATGLATLKKLLGDSLPNLRMIVLHRYDYSLRDMMLGLALTEDERSAFSY